MRRPSLRLLGLCAGLLICTNALALSLSSVSDSEASGGLKDALAQGAVAAVTTLGKPGGFGART